MSGGTNVFFFRPVIWLMVSSIGALTGLTIFAYGLGDRSVSELFWGFVLMAGSLWTAFVSLRWIWRWFRAFFS